MYSFLIVLTLFTHSTSIYSYSITTVEGQTISLAGFQGKKILFVNIATGSARVSQIGGLQQLNQQYGDSLVVIAFPSNSFGLEPRTNTEIKQFCQSNYSTSFIFAQKGSVRGSDAQAIFNWLAHASENGSADAVPADDFQKFLVNKDGVLVGVFSSLLAPTHSKITNAIIQQ
jgi:glutathione peroxidase